MADERLRLVAEVQDQFTGPLDRLNAKLQRVAAGGAQAAKDMKKDFEGFHGTLSKTASAMDGMIAPLRSMGAVSLGAGLGIGAITSAVAGFAKTGQQLKIMSTETGLAVDQIRAFSNLGARFGVSAETMQGALGTLSKNMSDIRKRWGEVYGDLQAMNLGSLVEKLVAAPNMKAALDAAMDQLASMGDPQKRRKVAEMLFGSGEIGAVAGQVTGKYRAMMDEIMRMQGTLDERTTKSADEFQKNLSRMGEAAERLKLNTLGPLLKSLNTIVESGDRAGIRGNAEAMEGTTQERLAKAQAKRDFLSSEAGGGAEKNSDRIKSLEREIARLTDEIKRTRENPAGPSGVSAIPMSYGGGGALAGLIHRANFGGVPGVSAGGMGRSFGGFGDMGPPLNPRAGGALSGSGDAAAGTADTPRGTGQGTRGAARTADMMRYAMDQLRREGVPEDQLRTAAAHLVGQAHMESGLDPNKVHDGGTGYGIYGARDPGGRGKQRRSEMLKWLRANGYAPNSAEGQMRYMSHEAMTDPSYRATRGVLMGRGTGNVEVDTNTITRNFEAPAVINRRSGAVRNALRIGPSEVPSGSAGADENGFFPNGAPRALKPLSMADDASVPGQVMGRIGPAGARAGDAMMRRLYGDQAPVARGGKGTLHIDFGNAPPGMRARASMDDLFSSTTISKQRQMELRGESNV